MTPRTREREPLLDLEPIGPERFAEVEGLVSDVLATRRDVVLVPAEAALALEAVARGLAQPGCTCLSLVTGPFSRLFAHWMRQGGARVEEITSELGAVVEPEEVERALRRTRADVVSLAHAEAATGSASPLEEICAVAARYEALTVVDAVASLGGHDLEIDAWDIDVCAIGPQKCMAGPLAVSAVTVSEAAWIRMDANPAAPRMSTLSLLDLRDAWIRTDRSVLAAPPSPHEMLALEAACRRVLEEGIDGVIERHRAATAAARAGVRALGLTPLVDDDDRACRVGTVLVVEDGQDATGLARLASRFGASLSPGHGDLRHRAIRIDHMGRGAMPAPVLASIAAVGTALTAFGRDADVTRALAAAAAEWEHLPQVP